MTAPLFGGGQEFLAVTVPPPMEGTTAIDTEDATMARGEALACTQLPLPYGPPAD
jgi:hypothetical protein